MMVVKLDLPFAGGACTSSCLPNNRHIQNPFLTCNAPAGQENRNTKMLPSTSDLLRLAWVLHNVPRLGWVLHNLPRLDWVLHNFFHFCADFWLERWCGFKDVQFC